MTGKADIHTDVAAYYGARLAAHGTTAAGVDWRDEASQCVRFDVLLGVVADPEGSVLDLGCGFGALLPYMRARGISGGYVGTDIAPEMVEAARGLQRGDARARFVLGNRPGTVEDYAVASGIFNVRLGHDGAAWAAYMEETVETMHGASRRGFAFNCLTSYSDADKMRPDLHYADGIGGTIDASGEFHDLFVELLFGDFPAGQKCLETECC